LGLWGNKRYLRAAGIRIATVEKPWTLQEFETAMQKLSAVPGVEYALNLDLAAGSNEYYSYAFAPILQGFGGDLIDRTAQASARGVLDGPESVAAMKRFQSWFPTELGKTRRPAQRLRAGQGCPVVEWSLVLFHLPPSAGPGSRAHATTRPGSGHQERNGLMELGDLEHLSLPGRGLEVPRATHDS
jgi:hypothetical protein